MSSLFGRRSEYDQKHLLREAREAQRRDKHKKALFLLRKIMIVEPNNAEINALLAPSLAECGLEFSAWECYERTAKAVLRDGKKQIALEFYRDATRRMPRHYESWKSRAALECNMDHKDDAIRTLKEALPHFRRRAAYYHLTSLLRRLLKLDPNHRDVILELASVLSKTRQKEEAQLMLVKLAETSDGRLLRQVRRTQWNISPSLAHSWLWLRSRLAGS
jgi:tetratricopeptide (TPR) repeat protein